MVSAVHRSNDCEKNLSGTDIARSLLATDVLLASLQCQAVGRISISIDTDTDESPRHAAFETCAHRHEAGVRSAKAHRNTETLSGTHHNIGTPLPRRGEQSETEEISRDNHQGLARMRGLGNTAQFADRA